MGRGVSCGGGQSSLGYLFGNGEAPKPATNNAHTTPNQGQAVNNGTSPKPTAALNQGQTVNNGSSPKPTATPPPVDISKQIPAGIHGNPANNYYRADGQNTGNFITDRPSTKVHSAPGGGSSLGYLFGGGGN